MSEAAIEQRLRAAVAAVDAPAFERCLFAEAAAFERTGAVAIATNRLAPWDTLAMPFEACELRPYTVWQRALIVGVAPGAGTIDVSRFQRAGWERSA